MSGIIPTSGFRAAGYDARNRLTSFARTGAGTTYSYDANSNRVSATEASSSELRRSPAP